jgi:APA family basic amino acid/polyamine antiporter
MAPDHRPTRSRFRVQPGDPDNGGDARPEQQRRVIGPGSALGICIGSMIGSGIFAVTGQIGPQLVSPLNIMLAWILAGVIALAGALTLAEVAAMRPRASAQYVVVHEMLGPRLGYVNGMITLLIGYLASMAAVAMIAGAYVARLVPDVDERMIATVLLLGLGGVHAATVVGGTRLNDVLVVLKSAVVVLLAVAGFTVTTEPFVPSTSVLEAARLLEPGSVLATVPVDATAAAIDAHLRTAASPPLLSATLGAAIVAVTFAYLGWSNAADVAGEVRRPGRNVPIAIVGSVLLVGSLYLIVNLVYLRVVPPAAMVEVGPDGRLQPMTSIGAVVAERLLGPVGGRLVTGAIVLLLASTLSVAVMTCGRVIAAMAWKGELPAAAGGLNRRGAPTVAIAAQIAASIGIVWITGLRSLLEYVGVLVTLAVVLTMLSAMLLRHRRPDDPRPFRMPLYPLPPLVSIGLGGWLVASAAAEDWIPVAAAAGTLAAMVAARPLLTRPLEIDDIGDHDGASRAS